MIDVITCPSGLSGRIRGMKVREGRILADQKRARRGSTVDSLLEACWEETLDSGPYDFGDKMIDWGKVLEGDRLFALLQIRSIGFGPAYPFTVPCESDQCSARIEWELDLTELPVRPLTAESRAAFCAGNRFEAVLPSAGKKVWFKLLVGADERRLTALQTRAGDNFLLSILGYRVLEVDGIAPADKRAFLEDLSMRDADFLLAEFDRVDCGVETGIEVECPTCFWVREVDLPFERHFFMPSQRRQKPSSRRST